jgi:hypothetical protein
MILPASRRVTRLATPAAALGCGMIASAGAGLPPALSVALALAAIVAWQFWREAVAENNWTLAVARWRDWHSGEPLPALPYTEPGSEAHRLAVVGGQFRAFAVRRLMPAYGPIIGGAVVALAAATLLGWALGPWALGLSVAALLSPQIAALGRGHSAGLALAAADAGLVELGLPFALGAGLIASPTASQIALGAAVAIAWAGLRAGRGALIWQAGNAAALGMLAAGRHSVGAFLYALCWLPQLLGGLGGVSRHAGRWLMAGLLAASIAAQ